MSTHTYNTATDTPDFITVGHMHNRNLTEQINVEDIAAYHIDERGNIAITKTNGDFTRTSTPLKDIQTDLDYSGHVFRPAIQVETGQKVSINRSNSVQNGLSKTQDSVKTPLVSIKGVDGSSFVVLNNDGNASNQAEIDHFCIPKELEGFQPQPNPMQR